MAKKIEPARAAAIAPSEAALIACRRASRMNGVSTGLGAPEDPEDLDRRDFALKEANGRASSELTQAF